MNRATEYRRWTCNDSSSRPDNDGPLALASYHISVTELHKDALPVALPPPHTRKGPKAVVDDTRTQSQEWSPRVLFVYAPSKVCYSCCVLRRGLLK